VPDAADAATVGAESVSGDVPEAAATTRGRIETTRAPRRARATRATAGTASWEASDAIASVVTAQTSVADESR
jgi:hypothetical protein